MRIGVAAVIVVAASAYFLVAVPRIFCFASGARTETVNADLADLDGAVVVDVGEGCENLYLEPASRRLYVTDRWGNVHLVDGPSREALRVVKSAKVGDRKALGIDGGPGGFLFVAACDGDWFEPGGGIFRVDSELESAVKIAGGFPGLNGLALDGRGDIYFAASNMSFLNGKGVIYQLRRRTGGNYRDAKVFLPDLRCVDGMFFDAAEGRMYFTETFGGVSKFKPGFLARDFVLGKTALFDFWGDLCSDANGDFWFADPCGFLKHFNAETRELTRYKIKGCGRPSSCRIRLEDGDEVIYVTELKRRGGLLAPLSKKCDGRGVVAIPLRALRESGKRG